MALHTAADSSRVVLGLGRKTQKSAARGSKGSIRKQWGSSAPPPEASGPYLAVTEEAPATEQRKHQLG